MGSKDEYVVLYHDFSGGNTIDYDFGGLFNSHVKALELVEYVVHGVDNEAAYVLKFPQRDLRVNHIVSNEPTLRANAMVIPIGRNSGSYHYHYDRPWQRAELTRLHRGSITVTDIKGTTPVVVPTSMMLVFRLVREHTQFNSSAAIEHPALDHRMHR